MAHRIRLHRTGGPEVLRYEEYRVGEPGSGQVRLVQQAAGVNFIDTQFRDGIYRAALPRSLGVEGVGLLAATWAQALGARVIATTYYPLPEARRAHEDIRARRVAGAMILVM